MAGDVVVVGSGYAGTAAIAELQRIDAPIDLTWISTNARHVVRHEMHRLIREPSLYDHLQIPIDRLVAPSTAFVEATVTEIDTVERALVLGDGSTVTYDYLLLTVGCRSAYYGIPGLEAHCIPMETIEHAQDVHERISAAIREPDGGGHPRIVVVGGGLTGVQTAGEVAGYVADRSSRTRITLVEALDAILPRESAPLRNRVRSALEASGVEIATDAPVVEVTDDEVVLASEERVPFDVLVWGGGITGRDVVLETGLTHERGRIRVDDTLATSDEHIFAVGDIALIPHEDGFVPPTAQAAWQAGPVAARNVLAAAREQRQESWTFRDKGTLVSVGDDAFAQDVVGIPVSTFDGAAARFLKKFVATRWIASLTSWREAAPLWRHL